MSKKSFNSATDNSSRAGITVLSKSSYPGKPQASAGMSSGGGGNVEKNYTTSKSKG